MKWMELTALIVVRKEYYEAYVKEIIMNIPLIGIVVVGTSNRIEAIDSALLRKGRLNQIIEMKSPDKIDAVAIFNYFSEKYKLSGMKFDIILCPFLGLIR